MGGAKHTDEPWKVEGKSGNDGEAYVIVAGNKTVGWTADSFEDGWEYSRITAEDRANSYRIVRCVNGLRGIPNDLVAELGKSAELRALVLHVLECTAARRKRGARKSKPEMRPVARDKDGKVMWLKGRTDLSPLTYREFREAQRCIGVHTDDGQDFRAPFQVNEEDVSEIGT